MLLKARSHGLYQTARGGRRAQRRPWTSERASPYPFTCCRIHLTEVSETLVDSLPIMCGATGKSEKVPSAFFAMPLFPLPDLWHPHPITGLLGFIQDAPPGEALVLLALFASPDQSKLQDRIYHVRLTLKAMMSPLKRQAFGTMGAGEKLRPWDPWYLLSFLWMKMWPLLRV